MGRGKRREPLFSLSPSHRAPRALFFFLPSLPTTQRGLYGEERQLTHMQPSTWPVPNACAKPYHPGVGQLSRPRGSAHRQISQHGIARLTKKPRTLAPGIGSVLFHLKACKCQGSGLLSHLRLCFDSSACTNHILRSKKLIWVSALTFLTVLVSLLSYSSLLKVHEQVIDMKIFIFLTSLSAFYEYSTSAKRAQRKPARETHAPIERLGSKRIQHGDGLLTRQNTRTVNWI